MIEYIATFYSHYGAICFRKSCQSMGLEAAVMPVPRNLSSSCGTCVRYEAEGDHRELLDSDAEALYEVLPSGAYHTLWRDEIHM